MTAPHDPSSLDRYDPGPAPNPPATPALSDPPREPSRTRRNVLWGMSTLSAAVLALSYQHSGVGTSPTAAASTSATSRSAASGSAVAEGAAGEPTAGTGSAAPSVGADSELADGTYTGASTSTRWGAVQVRIVVSGGKITSSQAIAYPDSNGRDQQINARAVPIYNQRAVTAQAADIDAVSGATVTWQGYTSSLQSAIDQARA